MTSIAFVADEALGGSSANADWLGTVLTDSLLRYPLLDDGSGFDFGDDQGLADRVDDNEQKGELGESAAYVVGSGFGIVTHIMRSPDDLLYVASISNGEVYRIGPADQSGADKGDVVEVTVGTDPGRSCSSTRRRSLSRRARPCACGTASPHDELCARALEAGRVRMRHRSVGQEGRGGALW